jgi:hypothetical protein
MAKPLRFRRSNEPWNVGRIRNQLLQPLDAKFGASMESPWYATPDAFQARRLGMDNGDTALFAWDDGHGYWLGNTETPSVLWNTQKYTFAEVPRPLSEWAERELLAQLHEESPWLAEYPTLSWFFLPVFHSKDGRHTTRTFFRDHAAGFADADRDPALSFYEDFLETGALSDRYLMASKLGTSTQIDLTRMRATMSEFTVAKVLHDHGYDVEPEIEVTTGHSIDFEATRSGGDGSDESNLVEVTRPLPPDERSADSAVGALRETAKTKTTGQLSKHGGGVTLLVDCSSFGDAQWREILDAEPDVGHRPAVVFRAWPDGRLEGYEIGSVPLDLHALVHPRANA